MDAPQGTNAISLEVLGTFQTGIFDESAAEIVAFDPDSDSLFVINADANAIDILDIADPTTPTLVTSIDLEPTVGPGSVNSVSVSNGIVAAAVANDDDTQAGSVVFLDTTGTVLNTVAVGILPDNVALSADGSFAVVANEGEPVGDGGDPELLAVDPEGTISVIDLSNGVENATVATADFAAFDGREADLVGDGVRIFPGRTVAQDVEPEFVAIAPDGTQAFVSLQENNAVALVDLTDLAAPSVADILPLGVTDFSQGLPFLESVSDVPLETDEFEIGTDAEGNPIFLGGLSGLAFDGFNPDNGNPQFLAINDRGPVEGTIDTDDPDSSDRPFITPDLQVTVLTLELDEATDTVSVVSSLGLTRTEDDVAGIPITGLTNIPGFFEVPVTVDGEALANDPFGLDSEGIIRDPNTNNLYVVEETAPSIAVFSPEGVLIDRFVPIGYADQGDEQTPGADFTAGDFGTETLPEVYLNRRNNRGFEAVAFDPEAGENGILYAFIQTPQSNPDTDTSNASSVLRILGIDPTTGTPVEEFVYLLQTPAAVSTDPEVGFGSQEVDRIGDAVFAGDGQFYVIERDNEDSDDAQQFIFQIDLQGATNILGTELSNATEGTTLESLSPDELAAAGIQAVDKIQVTNLPSLGFSPTPQTEGLALIPGDGENGDRLAVINDNDYEGPDSPTQLGVVAFGPSNGLDASDDDGIINIVNQPVFGFFQPDTIASFEIDGETFFITANEGDGRDSFDDLTDFDRIGDLTLDAEAFPDAATLQLDENLGRLEVSTIDGDLDGDGDFDQLFALGSRSFSIRDSLGNLVFDSGDDFEQITAELLPDDFNSDNDENGSFDSRSDDGGPEPEGLAIGEVDGALYAFIGLERIGGIAVYDISDPANSEFVQYINNRDFSVEAQLEDGTTNPAVGDLGPEGLAFISAEDSPTGQPLLAVGNEVSGTTTIFGITVGDAPDPDPVPNPVPVAADPDFLVSAASFAAEAEITAFDPGTNLLFSVSGDNAISLTDLSEPTEPVSLDPIDLEGLDGLAVGGANSISVSNGIAAVALENEVATDNGFVAFFDAETGAFLNSVEVGALPDNLTFTPDGQTVLVANEGESNGEDNEAFIADDAEFINPDGSISVIDLSGGVENATVTSADFSAFNDQVDALVGDVEGQGVRLADEVLDGTITVAQDLEPEFITVAPDGTTAFASLQENNAIAVIDVANATITDILPLGAIDHSVEGSGIDGSNSDGINIQPLPSTFGLLQPDAIASYEVDGETFFITANEGDSRDEVLEIGDDAVLDPALEAELGAELIADLEGLEVSGIDGDTDGDGDLDQLFTFGSRSFSIFDSEGTLVFNSGDDFEQITAEAIPDFFNTDDEENTLDDRSDDAGPEPEGVTVGEVDGVPVAFIALERIGGILSYDVSDPTAPVFLQYINTREFEDADGNPLAQESEAVGDSSPEGLTFISAEDSPNGQPLLVVAYEVSETVGVLSVGDIVAPPPAPVDPAVELLPDLDVGGTTVTATNFVVAADDADDLISVTLDGQSATETLELGFFVVDDAGAPLSLADGTAIDFGEDGFDSTDADDLQTLLGGSSFTLLTALASADGADETVPADLGAGESLTRIFDLDTALAGLGEGTDDANLAFFLVRGGSIASFVNEADGESQGGTLEFGDEFVSISEIDGDDADVEVEFEDAEITVTAGTAAAALPLGTPGQGTVGAGVSGELIDLTGVADADGDGTIAGAVAQNLSVAAFDNLVGFYQVDDASGAIGGIAADFSDPAYLQALLTSLVDVDLTGDGVADDTFVRSGAVETITDATFLFAPDALYAPVIFAQGGAAATADLDVLAAGGNASITDGELIAYGAFAGANTDNTDHVRLLGDNAFGFEDLFGGGDNDFNDVVIQLELTA